jgi:hypothetical protein
VPTSKFLRGLPDIEEAINTIQSLPGEGNIVTLEALQFQHDLERELACKELDQMAKLFAYQDAERKKLWGNKFPRVLGQKPPEESKSINPVKRGKGKRRGKSRNAL